jgi:hypothetical protein
MIENDVAAERTARDVGIVEGIDERQVRRRGDRRRAGETVALRIREAVGEVVKSQRKPEAELMERLYQSADPRNRSNYC